MQPYYYLTQYLQNGTKTKLNQHTQHLLLSRIPTCFVGYSRLHYSCLPQFCDSLFKKLT